MNVQVETRYLYGYAVQLDANREDALTSMEQYCRQHCLNFDGMDGTLYPARWGLEGLAESIIDMCDSARRGLWLTAHDLRLAGQAYDEADLEAAELLWTAGRAWSAPPDHRERDVAVTGVFSTGAEPNLASPPFTSRVGEVKDAIYQLLGTINDWIDRLTGYDLLGKPIPFTLGDSGAGQHAAVRAQLLCPAAQEGSGHDPDHHRLEKVSVEPVAVGLHRVAAHRGRLRSDRQADTCVQGRGRDAGGRPGRPA